MGFVDIVVVLLVSNAVDGVKAVLIFQDLPAFSLMFSVVMLVNTSNCCCEKINFDGEGGVRVTADAGSANSLFVKLGYCDGLGCARMR
jgi:hypothetical protein